MMKSYSINVLNAFLQWSKPRAEGPDPSQKHSGELRNDGDVCTRMCLQTRCVRAVSSF